MQRHTPPTGHRFVPVVHQGIGARFARPLAVDLGLEPFPRRAFDALGGMIGMGMRHLSEHLDHGRDREVALILGHQPFRGPRQLVVELHRSPPLVLVACH